MALIQGNGGLGSVDNTKPSQVNVSNVSQSGPTLTTPGPIGNSFILSTKYHVPINTHTQPSIYSHNSPWIIDSGATDHITSSLNWFQAYFKIKPINVNLPNGSSVTAQYSGIVQISPNFVLHNVLFVPNFNFNLISISKLISTLSCTLTFSTDFCHIQDVSSLKMIGLAKLKEELYHVEISKKESFPLSHRPLVNTSMSTPVTSHNLWHFRLGHLSGNRLDILHQEFPFISKHINETCDVCHLAKQRKLSFSQSMSRAFAIFELIHLDIWGPFSKISIHGHKYFLTILDDFSRYTWVILLKSKPEVQTHTKFHYLC